VHKIVCVVMLSMNETVVVEFEESELRSSVDTCAGKLAKQLLLSINEHHGGTSDKLSCGTVNNIVHQRLAIASDKDDLLEVGHCKHGNYESFFKNIPCFFRELGMIIRVE
jgi:hypothetical protein